MTTTNDLVKDTRLKRLWRLCRFHWFHVVDFQKYKKSEVLKVWMARQRLSLISEIFQNVDAPWNELQHGGGIKSKAKTATSVKKQPSVTPKTAFCNSKDSLLYLQRQPSVTPKIALATQKTVFGNSVGNSNTYLWQLRFKLKNSSGNSETCLWQLRWQLRICFL